MVACALAHVRCARVHGYIASKRLSRETWDKLLTWMVEKQGMAAQSPERRALMLDYLVQHFGQP